MSTHVRLRRRYDFHEMLADGIVHGIGILGALIGGAVLIRQAALAPGGAEVAAIGIYALGLIAVLTISCTYNMLPRWRFAGVMRRLDHSAIFVLIAATYTPFLQRGMDHPRVMALLIAIWLLAGLGVAMKCLLPARYDRLAVLFYLAMGWSGVLAVGPISSALPPLAMLLIVIGGLIYSAGVVFHVWERLRFQNAIWHAFVVTAAAVHYSAVFTTLHWDGL